MATALHAARNGLEQASSKVQEAATAAVTKFPLQNGNTAAERAPYGSGEPIKAPAGPASTAVKGSETYPSKAARNALFWTGPEQVQELEAEVTGTIPEWLTGSLVMNGGGDYAPMKHLFDGYGMLSKVRVGGGRAWGSQRHINTKAYRLYKRQGRVVLNEFATPPQGLTAYIQQMAAPFAAMLFGTRRFTPATDNACVSVYAVGPGAVAADERQRRSINTADEGLTDTSKQAVLLNAFTEDPFGSYIVDPTTLETIRQVYYPDRLPALMQTAHPAVMVDGSFVNFTRTFPFGGSHVFREDRVTHKRTEIAFVPDRHWLKAAWMHDFVCTDKHVVLLEHPLYFDYIAQMLGVEHEAVWMKWRPEEGCRVHLVTLDGSKPVQTFTTSTFTYVHCGNAFESEDGRTLHVDLAVFDDPNILNDLKLKNLRSGPEQGREVTGSQYMRLNIPLDAPCYSGSLIHIKGPQPLIPDAAAKHVDFVDFPSIHPGFKGRPYRWDTLVEDAAAQIEVDSEPNDPSYTISFNRWIHRMWLAVELSDA
eukprot:GHUV01010592.1.p1 GENE.GHUV01010592.1~~GHUV01010592.1.p1  ORF type:complete len:535 (+),score=145.73 GHUV01010592.1:183-1787(+)